MSVLRVHELVARAACWPPWTRRRRPCGIDPVPTRSEHIHVLKADLEDAARRLDDDHGKDRGRGNRDPGRQRRLRQGRVEPGDVSEPRRGTAAPPARASPAASASSRPGEACRSTSPHETAFRDPRGAFTSAAGNPRNHLTLTWSHLRDLNSRPTVYEKMARLLGRSLPTPCSSTEIAVVPHASATREGAPRRPGRDTRGHQNPPAGVTAG
jgi:hypothetical protein